VEGAGHERLRAVPGQFFDTPPAEGRGVMPYARNDDLARPWIKPGTPGLEHRIGGIEKQPGTGNIDYSPEAHQEMTDTRTPRCSVANSIPDQDVCLGREGAELAVVGWGSTFGPIHQAVRRARIAGQDVATSTSATSGRCPKICLSYSRASSISSCPR
jgi:2-oxoglutarate ferredoxin oxidoreductase subunit alpha